MAYFDISELDIRSLEGKVAIITGASSGIGLATTLLFLSKGCKVVGADLNPPSTNIDDDNFTYHRVDVTSWTDLCSLFATTKEHHQRIDIVFANAGIGPKADYFALESDDQGNLKQPTTVTYDVNVVAVANQLALGVHYMLRQEPKGGNIVLTSSCTGYQRFSAPDYVAAKAGVLGLVRSMRQGLNTSDRPIRLNAVAPSWTKTGLLPHEESKFEAVGTKTQPASAVAKSVGLLVGDDRWHGQCLYSFAGRYVEMEEPVQGAMLQAIGKTGLAEEDERVRFTGREAGAPRF